MTAEFWQYDTRVARRWNQDPKPNPSISNYACFGGNPIIYSDLKGDTLYPTINDDTKEITIHFEGKFMNRSGLALDKDEILDDFETDFKQVYEGTVKHNGELYQIVFDLKFEFVSTLEEVENTDHLVVFTKYRPYNKQTGSGSPGVTRTVGGKVSYVRGIDFPSDWSVRGLFGASRPYTLLHEMGHMMGIFGHDLGGIMTQGESNGSGNQAIRNEIYSNIVSENGENLEHKPAFIVKRTYPMLGANSPTKRFFDTTIYLKTMKFGPTNYSNGKDIWHWSTEAKSLGAATYSSLSLTKDH
ncbi:MAG: hypothetical protein AB8B53_08255 [Flavobacteriales bacterium]